MSRLVRLASSALLVVLGCRAARPPEAPPTATSPGAVTRYVRGTLVRTDGSALEDAVVVVEGNRIARVASAREVTVPAGTRVVGDPGKWILPGLVDAHVHFFQSGGLYTRPDIVDLTARVPYGEERASTRAGIEKALRRYLRSGITSVVDMGGPMWNFEVRALASRTALAPRVAVAGPLLASVARPQLEAGDPPIVQVTDPQAARAMVREQAAHRPDLVKLWYVVSPGTSPDDWLAVARAAVDEAHRLGLRVAVHATELETARTAVHAGADVLVHDVADADVDDEFVALLRERGTLYTSTLTVLEGYQAVFRRKVRLSPAVMEMADPLVVGTLLDPFAVPERFRGRTGPLVPPAAMRNALRLRKAGVGVAAGSDAGNIGTFHGPALHRELELLVEAGLTPADALAAATIEAARVMGREADLGSVEPGKLADLVLLDASPLVDIRNTTRIHAVVKGGTVHLPAEILPRSAADVVEAQLNAYNAQDLEAFLSTYADDAVIADAAGKPVTSGKRALRARYERLFRSFPENHCLIAERRTEEGSVVLYHEVITGRAPEKPDPWDVGWVRYHVEGGLIRRVTLP